ncbi:hypothetical protein [Yoonia algicola]|uniref:Uncharacterized protein n=1 Tax=Yoonia algicola TaxID=3137368 RepID=A0AAN0NIB5_9RHOB
MQFDSAYILGMLLSTFTDFRVLAICFVAVLVLPQWWMGVVVGALVSAIVIFYARLEMAPRLNIPDPGAVELAMDFARASIVAGFFAVIKSSFTKRWRS